MGSRRKDVKSADCGAKRLFLISRASSATHVVDSDSVIFVQEVVVDVQMRVENVLDIPRKTD